MAKPELTPIAELVGEKLSAPGIEMKIRKGMVEIPDWMAGAIIDSGYTFRELAVETERLAQYEALALEIEDKKGEPILLKSHVHHRPDLERHGFYMGEIRRPGFSFDSLFSVFGAMIPIHYRGHSRFVSRKNNEGEWKISKGYGCAFQGLPLKQPYEYDFGIATYEEVNPRVKADVISTADISVGREAITDDLPNLLVGMTDQQVELAHLAIAELMDAINHERSHLR